LVTLLLAGQTLSGVPQVSDFRLEFFDSFRTHAHLAILMDAKTRQTAVSGRPYAAFVAVDLYLQVFLNPFGDSFMDAFSTPLAAGKDGDVVGVTHETHPSLFELFIPRIKVDVCRQRAERSALLLTSLSLSRVRSPEASARPGKVHGLSARAVWIYPMRLSVTVGFRVL